MKTISFNEEELESLLMMYYDELSQAKQYVEQIQEIIKKLSGKPSKEKVKVEKLPKPVKKKKVTKPLAKPAENKPAKKAGRKSKVVAPSAESVVGSLLAIPPKKVVLKKVAAKKKKPTQKQRIQEMAASANLIKPEVK